MYFQHSAISACRIHWNFGAGALHLQRPLHRHTVSHMAPFSNVLRIVCTASRFPHVPQHAATMSPDTPFIKALWALPSMSTRRHKEALQRGTQPTPVVA